MESAASKVAEVGWINATMQSKLRLTGRTTTRKTLLRRCAARVTAGHEGRWGICRHVSPAVTGRD